MSSASLQLAEPQPRFKRSVDQRQVGDDGPLPSGRHRPADIVAREQQFIPALQERADGVLFVISAPRPGFRVSVRQEDVVKEDDGAGRQSGQDPIDGDVDIGPRHQDMT